jgi:hypothetical protein
MPSITKNFTWQISHILKLKFNTMKNLIIATLLFVSVFSCGIYLGAEIQKKETLNRALTFGETDFYSYEQVEYIILSNN